MQPIALVYLLDKNYKHINNEYKNSLQIFFRSYYKFLLLLEIMQSHYKLNNTTTSIEALCKKVHRSASRTTTINFINGVIELKLLDIDHSHKDKRIKIIKPSKILLEDFEKWATFIN